MSNEMAYSSLSDSTSDLEVFPSPSPEEKTKPFKNRCVPDILRSFAFDRMDLQAFEILWGEGEREKAVDALQGALLTVAEQNGIDSASTAKEKDLAAIARIRSDSASDESTKRNAILQVAGRVIGRWIDNVILTKNVEERVPKFRLNQRSSIHTTTTSHGAPLVIKVFGENSALQIHEFKNLLADQGDSFAPILGYSIVLNEEQNLVKELHIIMPCATQSLKEFLKVKPSLVNAIHLTFQLVRMVEEMRFNSKVLKLKVISSHCDIKTDNVILFRLPPPFGWLALFIDAETASAGNDLAPQPNADPVRTVFLSDENKKLLNAKVQRAHVQDMQRLSTTIGEIWKDIDGKKKVGLSNILDSFSGDDPHGFSEEDSHIFMKSLDLHVFCAGALCGFKKISDDDPFEKLKKLIITQPLPQELSQFVFVDLPEEVEGDEEFYNWLFLTKKEDRLFVNCTFSKKKPLEDCSILYCSREHAYTAQSHALTVLCQILEHLTLYFPFDPLLSSGDKTPHPYQRGDPFSSQGLVSSSSQ